MFLNSFRCRSHFFRDFTMSNTGQQHDLFVRDAGYESLSHSMKWRAKWSRSWETKINRLNRLWSYLSVCHAVLACLILVLSTRYSEVYILNTKVYFMISNHLVIWRKHSTVLSTRIVSSYWNQTECDRWVQWNMHVYLSINIKTHVYLNAYASMTIYVYDRYNWFRWLSWSIHVFCDSRLWSTATALNLRLRLDNLWVLATCLFHRLWTTSLKEV